MSTDYNVLIDIGRVDPDGLDLDVLAEWSAVAAGTPLGTVEVVLTIPARTLRQAAATGLSVVEAAGLETRSVRVLTTAAYDAGLDVGVEPETVSVADAARILGISPQAVRQRLGAGSLPGRRVGRDWRIPRASVIPAGAPIAASA